MTLRSILTGAIGVALGLALSAGIALAQTGPSIGGYPSAGTQRQLMNSPGYNVGTGSAHIGGYPSPATQQELMNSPGYSVGGASYEQWPAYCYTASGKERQQHQECQGAPRE
jgi:hypothetical protein